MHLKGRAGRLGLILALLSLLLCPTFSILVKATLANSFTIDWRYNDANIFNLPGGGTFSVQGATWSIINGTGCKYFDGIGDRGQGYLTPQSNIANFTFTVEFFHLKADSGRKNELIAGIWYEALAKRGNYLLIGLTDCDTDSPMISIYIGERTEVSTIVNTKAHFNGIIANNEWYNLKITYCNNTGFFYAYLNEQLCGRGQYNLTYGYWLKQGTAYDFDIGAYPEYWLGMWGDWFKGYIHYAKLTDTYSSPFATTELALWYHFNEGSGTVAEDYSGGDYDGEVDDETWQWQENSLPMDNSSFGYTMTGTTHNAQFGIALPDDIPLITDKFTVGIWFRAPDCCGVSTTHMSTHVFYTTSCYVSADVYGGSPSQNRRFMFTLASTIGGTERTINTGWWYNNDDQGDKWYFLYGNYDGDELNFTVICENGTVVFTDADAYAGTITAFPKLSGYSDTYGFASYKFGSYDEGSYEFDEFKLTREMLSPYEMNGTTFGTVVPPIVNTTLEISARMDPSQIVCTPTSTYPYGIGTAIITVNSSDNFFINLTQASVLTQYFDITPQALSVGTLYDGPTVQCKIPVTFVAKNNTNPGNTYSGSFLAYIYNAPYEFVELKFQLTIYWVPPVGTNQSTFKCTWSKQPLELYWNTIITDSDYLYATNIQSGLPIFFDVQSLYFKYPTNYKSRAYNSTFVRYWNIEEGTTYPLTGSWYKFTYGIDENVAGYGNFTVEHKLKVTNRNNPSDVCYVTNYVNIFVNQNVSIQMKIWCVVYPSTITDYSNVSDRADLYLYANYETDLSWYPKIVGMGWEPWYIHCYGNPSANAICPVNSSVHLSIILPSAIDDFSLELWVYDVKNPNFKNSTILSITTISPIPGIDFTWEISPVDVYFDLSKTVGTPHVTGQLYCMNSHAFFLSLSKTSHFNGLNIQFPSDLGSTSSSSPGIYVDIIFSVNTQVIVNGDYPVEFDAFYVAADNTKPFIARTVTVHVIGSPNIVNPITPVTPVTPITPVNMTTITPTTVIPVTGMGSGWFRNLLGSVSVGLGWPFDAVAFLVGLVIMLAVVIIIGRTAPNAPNIVHLFGALGAIALDVTIGLWPMWIAILLGVFGAALLSFSVVRGIGGKGGGKPEE